MSNIEKAMAHLRVIYAYTAFAHKRDTCFLGLQVICDIEERASDALALLEEQKAKPPIHVHLEYPEHDWKTNEKGELDDFAWDQEYCNGPMCKRCYYAFCIHCEPNGWDKKPCIVDFFKCPNCGEKISKNTKFCDNCGQAVKWE